MKNLKTYMQLKERMNEINAEIDSIESTESFKEELLFLNELEELLTLHGKSKKETAEILYPKPEEVKSFAIKPRKKREPKTYKNPKTGQTVTTAGGNHTILRQWREENPDVNLADWVI